MPLFVLTHIKTTTMLARVPVTSESSDQEPARWDERDWEDLLDYVADHSIIPIVGSELLTVEFEGGTFPLYRVLAEKLAQRLRLPTKSLTKLSWSSRASFCVF